MNAAYEALPKELKERITQLKTTNTLMSSTRFKTGNPDIVRERQESKAPPMVQPLVRTHPERGTKAIWFHKGKVETVTGMDPYESQDFLAEILEAALQPEFIYVHEWKTRAIYFSSIIARQCIKLALITITVSTGTSTAFWFAATDRTNGQYLYIRCSDSR